MSIDQLGRVIVGSGHFLASSAPAMANSLSGISNTVGRIFVGAGHNQAEISMAHVARAGVIDSFANRIPTRQEYDEIVRLVSDTESAAWDNFIDRSRDIGNRIADSHQGQAAKEFALSVAEGASGNFGEALEHAMNATIEVGKGFVELHQDYQSGWNGLTDRE